MAENETLLPVLITIEQLNKEEVIRLIPLIIFLTLISVIGIPGNGLVCYIYGTKYRLSSSRWFILFLAIIDLFLCVIIVPGEIATTLYQYNFSNVLACKIITFLNCWSLLCLAFILVIVAVDRYRKVCKPIAWQINAIRGKILSLLAIGIGFLISLPNLWVYGIKQYELVGHNITGTACSFSKEASNSPLTFFYLIFGLFLITASLIIICVMYCFIGKSIRRQLDRVKSSRRDKSIEYKQTGAILMQGSTKTNKTLVQDKFSFHCLKSRTHESKNLDTELKRLDRFNESDPAGQDSTTNPDSINDESNTYEFYSVTQPQELLEHRRLETRKATFSMFLISLAFVMSYLPTLLLLLVRSVNSDFEASLTNTGRVAYKFFLRMCFLDCAINPFIYGLSDSRFRASYKEIISKFRNKVKCRPKTKLVIEKY